MGSGSERLRSASLGVAAGLLSATALWYAGGLHPAWWLMWLAPVPVLAFALRSSGTVAACASFAAWAGGGLDLWHYYRSTLGMPLPIVLVALALPAVAFALGTLLTRSLVCSGRLLLATLTLPAWWTAFEHLTARVSPHGTFGSLAYTQMDFLPVVQVASVCGASGIAFLLMIVPTTIAVATLPAGALARWRIVLMTSTLVMAALAYGGWRLADKEPATTLLVGLVAADHPPQPATAPEAQELVARYAAADLELAAAGADVIVLPETIVRIPDGEAQAIAGRLAGSGRSVIVTGLALQGKAGERNAALALGPHLAEPVIYAKHHLLFPPESRYHAGTAFALVPLKTVVAGLAICKDLDFQRLGRDYAQRGAALLLVPAWDFGVDGWLHSRMAVLRGIEGGFAVARSARGGRLTLSDNRGRVLAEAGSADRRTTTLLAGLPVETPGTPYSRLGDWFGWLCCTLALGASVAVWRRPPAAPHSAKA
jgi:apolipoprotein N-acyltransferase